MAADFGRWLRSQEGTQALEDLTSREALQAAHERELEESGTAWRVHDGWAGECCRCGISFLLPVGPMELQRGEQFYCNGSPRCIP